ncbi:hypothetical protein EE612_058411 [Oryza sativa]|nr:hypothetical protein EE612_058411 [Oryza sativa]
MATSTVASTALSKIAIDMSTEPQSPLSRNALGVPIIVTTLSSISIIPSISCRSSSSFSPFLILMSNSNITSATIPMPLLGPVISIIEPCKTYNYIITLHRKNKKCLKLIIS